jgi:ketosteroid isomerase-like protein
MATGRDVAQVFAGGDAAAVVGALAADATFHSPVADYQGRQQFAPVLQALATVVTDATIVSVHEGSAETVAFFTATVEGRRADGILRVIADSDQPATALMLMIRPLSTLLAGVKAMERALA